MYCTEHALRVNPATLGAYWTFDCSTGHDETEPRCIGHQFARPLHTVDRQRDDDGYTAPGRRQPRRAS